jgi:hypothetical protein
MSQRWHANGRAALALLALALTRPGWADAPPGPWVARDVGQPGAPGSTSVDASGVWTLQGSGLDIWDDYDQFQLASQSMKGDGSISARILTATGGDSTWRKAGLMVRDDDTPGAANLFYGMTPAVGLYTQARFESDLPSRSMPGVGPTNSQIPNLALRLQRVGQEFAGFYSRDGALWFQAGFGPVALPRLKDEALWGLALTAHQDGHLATARFDQVSLQPGVTSPYGILTAGSDRTVQLQWRRLPNAVGYYVYRGAKGATRDQLTRLTAQPLTTPSYTDTGGDLTNGTPMLYAVSAVFQAADGTQTESQAVARFGTPIDVGQGLVGYSLNEGPAPGSASRDPATGVITLHGSGFDIWNAQDQGFFLLKPVDGDTQISVRMLTRHSNADGGKPAGLIIRESLEPGARSVLVGTWTQTGIGRQWRLNTDDWTDWSQSISDPAFHPPILLRLTRQGDTITPAYSVDDGKTFVTGRAISFPTPLPRTVYVGVAAASGRRASAGQIQFRDLVIP